MARDTRPADSGHGLTGRSIEAVVFDLDGVLVDSEPVHYRALKAFVAPGELTEETYLSIVGTSVEETMLWVRRTYGRTEPIEEMRAASSALVYDELTRGPLQALDGARELVEAVVARGLRVAVASQSSPRWVEATLRSIGLDDLLTTVVTASEVAHGKPAPDIYLHAAERVGVEPAACLAIEDSDPGVRSASAAGLAVVQTRQTATAAPPMAQAHAVIDSLRAFDLRWLG
ncbi:MAG: HAD-IA family hydrolase [Dehalococcoidia bacterium]|nr:HAD-IA family hydrolase [Dehalococcoidia bacterium]